MLLKILAGVGGVYALVLALSCAFQRKLQYFPDPAEVRLPPGEPYRGLRDVELESRDGTKLRAWYWPGTRDATVVVFGGNGGHRGYRLEWLCSLHGLGLGVFIVDYRGYGGSDGTPSESGIYADAEAAVEWLEREGAPGLVYLGESLGSGVAVDLGVRRPPRAMIIQSGFSSAVDVGARAYPFLPVRLFMRDRYESAGKIARLDAPILCIHGDADTIVPMDIGRALFDAAREPKEWHVVRGAGHNDLVWRGGREYLHRIDDFIRRHVEG